MTLRTKADRKFATKVNFERRLKKKKKKTFRGPRKLAQGMSKEIRPEENCTHLRVYGREQVLLLKGNGLLSEWFSWWLILKFLCYCYCSFFVCFSGARNGTQGLRNARSGELHS